MGAEDFGVKERLLNSTAYRFQLTRPSRVGPTMQLIHECDPQSLAEWEDYYWENAFTESKSKIKVTPELLERLGADLFDKITKVVRPEMLVALDTVTIDDCVNFIKDVTINRTFDGYHRENVVVRELAVRFDGRIVFRKSDTKTDSALDVDWIGDIVGSDRKVGIQVKPASAKAEHAGYSRTERVQENFSKFEIEQNGRVFLVIVKAQGKKRVIVNHEVFDQIESYLAEK